MWITEYEMFFFYKKLAVYSVYYDGVESTAQYSLLNTHE